MSSVPCGKSAFVELTYTSHFVAPFVVAGILWVRNRTRWPFDKLVSHTYPLEQINKAFADSEWHGRDTTTITRAALAP